MNDHKTTQLKQTHCLCAAARRASRAVTQLYDLVLSPAGLKATQFTMLLAIAEAGELAQWQLAQSHAVATETLSRRLSVIRKRGWVEVRRGSRKGERVYKLTDYGYECLRKALPHWETAQRRVAQALGRQAHDDAIALLDRITVAAGEAQFIRTCNAIRSPAERPGLSPGQPPSQQAKVCGV